MSAATHAQPRANLFADFIQVLTLDELPQAHIAGEVDAVMVVRGADAQWAAHWFVWALSERLGCPLAVTSDLGQPLAFSSLDEVVQALHERGFKGNVDIVCEAQPVWN